MRIAFAAWVVALTVAQEPAEPAVPPCALDRVEERDGSFEAFFTCAWPQGTVVRLEIQQRTTHVSWVPWLGKLPNGQEEERVNVSVRERGRTVHRDFVTLKQAGAFSLTWKPKLAGVYHLLIVREPDGEAPESRTVHRVLFVKAGQARECLVDDAEQAIRGAAEFFRVLRAAIQESTTEQELHERMGKLMDAATRQGRRSHHPGSYSLLEILSPYVAVESRDPEKSGNEPLKFIPKKLDLKAGRVPPGVVRESMMLALLWMEDALAEAALLAPLPEDRDTGTRRSAAILLGEELVGAVKGLQKLEGAAQVAALRRNTKFDDLMAAGNECIKTMLEKRRVNESAMKEWLDGMKAAARIISHPVDSLKE